MSLKEIRNELNEIERLLNMSFEEMIREALEDGEIDSYAPYQKCSKEELQMSYVKTVIDNFDEYKMNLLVRARELNDILDEAQSLQHTLNMFEETIISPTIKTVVERQTRKNYLDIEKEQGSYPDDMIWVYTEIFTTDINCKNIDKKSILNEGWW